MEIDKLNFLKGTWKGRGIAQYPTIQPVDYIEELVFKKDDDFQLFFYEQKTWIMNEEGKFNKSIFWESGFIIDKGEYLELCNVQKSGRMEILIGKLNYLSDDNKIEIYFRNKNIFNDERMISSGRKFIISESEIKYELHMSTSKNLNYDIHLNASLRKVHRTANNICAS